MRDKERLGEKLLELIDVVEETFEDEKVRKMLEEALEIRLEKTPAQDYVEMCMEALASDKIAIRILQEIAQSGPLGVENLKNNIERKYGMKCTRDEIWEKLRKIKLFGLLSDCSNSEIKMIERYRKYIYPPWKVSSGGLE